MLQGDWLAQVVQVDRAPQQLQRIHELLPGQQQVPRRPQVHLRQPPQVGREADVVVNAVAIVVLLMLFPVVVVLIAIAVAVDLALVVLVRT